MVFSGRRSIIPLKLQNEGAKRGHIMRTLIAVPRGGKLWGSPRSSVSAGAEGF
jgi:hypothetical protein